MGKRRLPTGFMVLLFILVLVMIGLAIFRDDVLFYVRAGIFGIAGIFVMWWNKRIK